MRVRAPASSAAEAACVPSAGGIVWVPDKRCLTPLSLSSALYSAHHAKTKTKPKEKKKPYRQNQKEIPCPLFFFLREGTE